MTMPLGGDLDPLVEAFRAALDGDENDTVLLLMRMPEELRAPWLAVQLANLRRDNKRDFKSIREDIQAMAPGRLIQALVTALGVGIGTGAVIGVQQLWHIVF